MRKDEQAEFDFINRNMGKEVARRRLLEWMVKAGWSLPAAGFLSAGVLSACGGGKGGIGGGESGGGFGGGGDEMKIAVIGPFSGIGSFIGAILERSLDASTQQINSTGGIGGRKIRLEKKDISAADVQQVINAYQDIASAGDFAGIIWGVPGGIKDQADRIGTDQILISGCFIDLFSDGELYPQNKQLRPVFQFLIPTNWSIKVLLEYVKDNRGFSRIGLIYDNTGGDTVAERVRQFAGDAGVSVTGTAGYTLNNSNFGPQISQVGNPQSMWMWGLATDTANAIKQLQDQGKQYTDINGAKSGEHPQPMGSPAALGERKWAELAGDAAKAGTLTAWHVGGLIYLPQFQIREWMKKYLDKFPTGGEESPADSLYMIASAVKSAGSITDRAKLIEAVEKAGKQKFASIDFEFGPDNHLSKHPDDLIIATLERGKPANDTYKLGREWKDVFPPGYVGPTQLVNPTLDANRRRHPDVMKTIVDEGWGTQCPLDNPIH